MRLGYPGGPILEKEAAHQGFQDFFHYPRSTAQIYILVFRD